jgi:predicted nuclease of predicted toxin-antitoxin system
MTESAANWHEFDWNGAPRMPRGPHKKLKLYVDMNVPEPLIQELRSTGLTIHLARIRGSAGRPDQNIYQEARKRGLVLLTMDRDFWKDSEHPLQMTAGIIFVDISPDKYEKACDALARFYAMFAKHYPLDWWNGMKARIYEHGFVLRYHTWDGQVFEDEFRLSEDNKLLTRSLR